MNLDPHSSYVMFILRTLFHFHLKSFFPNWEAPGSKEQCGWQIVELGWLKYRKHITPSLFKLIQGKLKHDCLNSCYCFRQEFRTAFLKRESGNNLDPAVLFVYMSSGIMGLVRIFVHKLLLDLSNYHPSPLRLWQQKAYFFAISYNSKTSEKHNTKLMHNISRNVDSI